MVYSWRDSLEGRGVELGRGSPLVWRMRDITAVIDRYGIYDRTRTRRDDASHNHKRARGDVGIGNHSPRAFRRACPWPSRLRPTIAHCAERDSRHHQRWDRAVRTAHSQGTGYPRARRSEDRLADQRRRPTGVRHIATRHARQGHLRPRCAWGRRMGYRLCLRRTGLLASAIQVRQPRSHLAGDRAIELIVVATARPRPSGRLSNAMARPTHQAIVLDIERAAADARLISGIRSDR
jgi:hypothetical protein